MDTSPPKKPPETGLPGRFNYHRRKPGGNLRFLQANSGGMLAAGRAEC